MSFPRAGRLGFALLLLVTIAGCIFDPSGSYDEQKEPHYLTGKSRVAAYDYPGAAQAFQRALEANPKSGSAHLELGLLLSDKETVLDYAAAIFHLQNYLRLQTNAHNADMIRERIAVCKQGLAREVPLGPVTQQVQREIMKLTSENARLTNEVAVLRQQLDQMRLYFAQRAAVPTNPPPEQPISLPPGLGANRQPQPAPSSPGVTQGPGRAPVGQATTNRPAGNLTGPAARIVPTNAVAQPTAPGQAKRATPPAAQRTYTVRSGDTPSAIAKRFGVKLSELLAANPGLNPNRMRPNQSLNIPGP
jgi:LysM repeat protein